MLFPKSVVFYWKTFCCWFFLVYLFIFVIVVVVVVVVIVLFLSTIPNLQFTSGLPSICYEIFKCSVLCIHPDIFGTVMISASSCGWVTNIDTNQLPTSVKTSNITVKPPTLVTRMFRHSSGIMALHTQWNLKRSLCAEASRRIRTQNLPV